MTRPSEGELVELQRKALGVFARVDNLADFVCNNSVFKQGTCDQVQSAAQLAREVSDAVDHLADYVRRSQ